jgi:hypothetical protein
MGIIKEIRVDIPNDNHLTQVIVTVETTDGEIGRGEAWWGIPNPRYPGSTSFPIASVIENLITPHLIGKDNRTIEKHWFEIWEYGYRYADQGIFTMGLSGVDLALWDLLGKQLQVPVVQLLGGAIYDALPAYASLPPLRDPDLVVSEVKRAIEAGFTAVKLHETDPMFVHLLHNNFGDSSTFSVTSSVGGILSVEANIAQSADRGKNIEGTINNQLALGEGQYLTTIQGMEAAGVTVKYDKELGYNEIPVFDDAGLRIGTQFIKQKNEDIVGGPNNPKKEGYVHVSQMSKEFQVGIDKQSNSAFSFANVRTSRMGNGIKNKSGFLSLADINVKTSQGANDAAKIVGQAIDQISVYRGELGSFQKNTLESNLISLKVAEENITQAESTLRDSDMAAEMSNLTKDQIMLEASTAMIAQANQVPKTVLGLIQNSS